MHVVHNLAKFLNLIEVRYKATGYSEAAHVVGLLLVTYVLVRRFAYQG